MRLALELTAVETSHALFARVAILCITGLSAFSLGACGADNPSASNESAIDSVALSALTPKQLGTLCAVLVPKIRAAETATHQCTLSALTSSPADAASCTSSEQSCVQMKAYDDWNKAGCADFADDDAGVVTPHFACDTKVSEVTACFDEVATWLAALSCASIGTANDKSGSLPACLTAIQTGDCKFAVDALLKNKDFHAQPTVADGYVCKSSDGDVPYDIAVGAACNACATSHCCDSYVACLSETACSCFIGCGEKDQASCYSMCSISADPQQFVDHYTCIRDNCDTDCAALFTGK